MELRVKLMWVASGLSWMGTISRLALAQDAARSASSQAHRAGHNVRAAAPHAHATITTQQRHFATPSEPITSHIYATGYLK